MPKKCESCKHYQNPIGRRFDMGWCHSPNMLDHPVQRPIPVPITAARELCDKEGDGIFVYFEPRPASEAVIKEAA